MIITPDLGVSGRSNSKCSSFPHDGGTNCSYRNRGTLCKLFSLSITSIHLRKISPYFQIQWGNICPFLYLQPSLLARPWNNVLEATLLLWEKLGCLERDWIVTFLNFPEEANCKGISCFLCMHICFGAKWKGELRKKTDKLTNYLENIVLPKPDQTMQGEGVNTEFFPFYSSPAALPFTPLGGLYESDLQYHPFRVIFPALQSPPCFTLIPQWKKVSPSDLRVGLGEIQSGMGFSAVPVPPHLIHSLASLKMSYNKAKGRAALSLRKHICEFIQHTVKSQKHIRGRKIKHVDWEKSFFQPFWCDSSKSYEVYMPGTNYADLPPGHGRVRAGKRC